MFQLFSLNIANFLNEEQDESLKNKKNLAFKSHTKNEDIFLLFTFVWGTVSGVVCADSLNPNSNKKLNSIIVLLTKKFPLFKVYSTLNFSKLNEFQKTHCLSLFLLGFTIGMSCSIGRNKTTFTSNYYETSTKLSLYILQIGFMFFRFCIYSELDKCSLFDKQNNGRLVVKDSGNNRQHYLDLSNKLNMSQTFSILSKFFKRDSAKAISNPLIQSLIDQITELKKSNDQSAQTFTAIRNCIESDTQLLHLYNKGMQKGVSYLLPLPTFEPLTSSNSIVDEWKHQALLKSHYLKLRTRFESFLEYNPDFQLALADKINS